MNYHKKLQSIGFKKCAPLVFFDGSYKYSNRVIENDKTFIIDTDRLNDHFWKNILDNLDTQHRREVLLKEII